MKKAYALGITNGVTPTTFDPYTNISREQLATMLTRVYKSLSLPRLDPAQRRAVHPDYTGVTPFADDGYISAYAKPSVYFMVKNWGHQRPDPHHLRPPERHFRPDGHRLRQRHPGAGHHHGRADVPEAVILRRPALILFLGRQVPVWRNRFVQVQGFCAILRENLAPSVGVVCHTNG